MAKPTLGGPGRASRASEACWENPSNKMAAIKRTRFLYRIVSRTFHSDVRTASLNENEYNSARLTPDDSNPKIIPIEGVIFDMDGTLTVPVYDFLKLRERLGLPHEVDVLKAVEAMDSSESRAAAHKVIEEFEEEGLRCLQLQPHAVDLLRFVSQHSVGRALVTRNSQRSVQVFLTALQAGLVDGTSINENGQDVPWPIFSEVNCTSAIVAVCMCVCMYMPMPMWQCCRACSLIPPASCVAKRRWVMLAFDNMACLHHPTPPHPSTPLPLVVLRDAGLVGHV